MLATFTSYKLCKFAEQKTIDMSKVCTTSFHSVGDEYRLPPYKYSAQWNIPSVATQVGFTQCIQI